MFDEIIATIGREIPVGKLDGTGSGFGLSPCPTCGRVIDTSCSACSPAPGTTLLTLEEALSRREELRSQQRRERSWYERGRR